MKQWAVWALLLCIGIPLAAQNQPNVTVYVEPVIGTDSGPEDIEYFNRLIPEKLEEQNFSVVRTPQLADYTLTGTIVRQKTSDAQEPFFEQGTPYGNDEQLPDSSADLLFTYGGASGGRLPSMYILHLTLLDNGTGETVDKLDLFYTAPNEIDELILLQINSLLNIAGTRPPSRGNIPPVIIVSSDGWRNRTWYFGGQAFWTPRVYEGNSTSTYYTNFGGGLFAEYHFLKLATGKREFLKFFAAGTGIELVPDWVADTDLPDDNYWDCVLEIPVLIKGVFKPASYFALSPYAGVNLNLALLRKTKPPLFAWKLGFQYGVKAGPGIIVIDPWFSMDMGKSSLAAERIGESGQYQRYMMHIAIGYKYGIDNFDFLRAKK
jgi:hypothetical protein